MEIIEINRKPEAKRIKQMEKEIIENVSDT
jgi:hypothetical protein